MTSGLMTLLAAGREALRDGYTGRHRSMVGAS